MYSKSLLITAIGFEAAKREAINQARSLYEACRSRLSLAIEEYDRKHYQTVECTGDIRCERKNVRHKADCLGRTEPIDVFWGGIQKLPDLDELDIQ